MIYLIIISFFSSTSASYNDTSSLLFTSLKPFPTYVSSDYLSDVLDIIFYKYSHSSEEITKSEFQSLIDCLNGVSECSPSKSPSIQELLNLYPRCLNESSCHLLTRCVSAESLSKLLSSHQNLSSSTFSREDFKFLSPVLLYQAQSQLCHNPENNNQSSFEDKKPTSAEVWGYGILFVTLISACSLFGVSVLPFMAKDFYQKLLTALIGLAVGSLAGSAVFHLIPQAFKIEADEDGEHSYLFISLAVLGGVWGFFMIESIIKIVLAAQTHRRRGHFQNSLSAQAFVSENHTKADAPHCNTIFSCDDKEDALHTSNGIVRELPNSACLKDKEQDRQEVTYSSEKCSDGSLDVESCHLTDVELIYNSQKQAMKASFGHVQERPEKRQSIDVRFHQIHNKKESVIATVAWMIIFGDGFHNFIDGVSIGAAFQQSILTGISISLAVMCEELPHELGDFAVLLNSGMAMKQALFYNFLSATTCYGGMVIGILLGEFTENSTYIFAIAGGVFLYISLADMIPEMNDTLQKASNKGPWEAIKVLIYQNIGIFIGVASLFTLAYYQDKLTLE